MEGELLEDIDSDVSARVKIGDLGMLSDKPLGEPDKDFDPASVIVHDKSSIPDGHSVKLDDTGHKYVLVDDAMNEVIGEYPTDRITWAVASSQSWTQQDSGDEVMEDPNSKMSEIWSHFTKSSDKKKATCRYCKNTYSIASTGSTCKIYYSTCSLS